MFCYFVAMQKLFLFFIINLISLFSISQQVAIGEWRDLLTYSNVGKVAMANQKIYAASQSGMFYVDLEDNSIQRLSTTNGLNGIQATALNAPESGNYLFVGYEDGSFDIIEGQKIQTVNDIKRSQIVGNKQVNHFNFYDSTTCFISTGFGILQYNPIKREFKETFIIGQGGTNVFVNSTVVFRDTLYALSNSGIYKGALGSYLFDPNNWEKDNSFPKLNNDLNPGIVFRDELHVNVVSKSFRQDTVYTYSNGAWLLNDTLTNENNRSFSVKGNNLLVANSASFEVYDTSWSVVRREFESNGEAISPQYAIYGTNDEIWFGDENLGLIRNYQAFNNNEYYLSGPASNKSFRLNSGRSSIYVSAGGYSDLQIRLANKPEVSRLSNDIWTPFSKRTVDGFDTLTDVVHATENPRDDSEFAIATMSGGVVLFKNDAVTNIFGFENSPLSSIQNIATYVTGVDYDNEGNLWMANSLSFQPIHVLTNSNEWVSFTIGNQNSPEKTNQLIATPWGHIWYIIPGIGIGVLDYNGTLNNFSDDRYLELTPTVNLGHLPSNEITAMKIDYDGHMWVGSNAGLRVFYNASRIFDRTDIDSRDIYINQDGQTQILLENQFVTDFYVDPSNRKWISTRGNGVYLMSPDGTEEVQHFTEENSPIYTDNVNSVAVNEKTGEALFATEKGIIAYRETATQSGDFSNIYAFPNPVLPDYKGIIGINGMSNESSVIITNAAGNKIYETTSSGGQATWDATDFNGNRVPGGVYLIFCISPEGENKGVAKLLIEN